MPIPGWIGFIIGLIVILTLANFKKFPLWGAIFSGAFIFVLLTGINIINTLKDTFLNPAYIFLTLAVSVVPILGGFMKDAGMMMKLVRNLNISKQGKLMFYPALLGLLPIPGGALFSAPLVEEIAPELDKARKVAINVWFRHVLVFIYPLSATLIIAAQITNHPFWEMIGILSIPTIFLLIVGYITLIKGAVKDTEHNSTDIKIFLKYLFPILISPLFEGIGEALLPDTMATELVSIYRNLFFFIGMLFSLLIVLVMISKENKTRSDGIAEISDRDVEIMQYLGDKSTYGLIKTIPRVAKNTRFWRFPLVILSMLYFLEAFRSSDVPEFLGTLNLNLNIYLIIAFFLGFATGRVQLPLSILFPIYMAQIGIMTMPYFDLILLYTSIFMGYVATPVHPCISLSLEFFGIEFKKVAKRLLTPTLIVMIALILSANINI